MTIKQILDKHKRIALQFSGGKDSLACLLLLQDQLEKITVYWLNAGDGFPENQEVIEKAKEIIPNFVEVKSSVADVIIGHGIPSDLISYGATIHAHALNGSNAPLMQDRIACCFRSIMQPMHQRMIQDGITLIIRGQKKQDEHKGALVSGSIVDGIEFLYPIEDWTLTEVLEFINKHGYQTQRYYKEGMTHAPECMTCTAWWDDGHGKYLAKNYPEKHKIYREKLKVIESSIAVTMQNLNRELYEQYV